MSTLEYSIIFSVLCDNVIYDSDMCDNTVTVMYDIIFHSINKSNIKKDKTKSIIITNKLLTGCDAWT